MQTTFGSNADADFDEVARLGSPAGAAMANGRRLEFAELAKVKAGFFCPSHAEANELLLVRRHSRHRDRADVVANEDGFQILPRGVAAITAAGECWVVLLEPTTGKQSCSSNHDLTNSIEQHLAQPSADQQPRREQET